MERPTESTNRSPLLYFNCSEWASWSAVSRNIAVVKMAFWKVFSGDCGTSMADKKDKTLCIGRGYSCENKMLPIPWLEMSHLNNHLIYRVVGRTPRLWYHLGRDPLLLSLLWVRGWRSVAVARTALLIKVKAADLMHGHHSSYEDLDHEPNGQGQV